MTRQSLVKLGYSDSSDDLESWEVEAFCLIAAEINKLENLDMKKQARKR